MYMFCSPTKSKFEMWKAHKTQYHALISERTSFTANCKTASAALVLPKWHIKPVSGLSWGYREWSKVNDIKPCCKSKLIAKGTFLSENSRNHFVELVWGSIYGQSLECLNHWHKMPAKSTMLTGLADHDTQEERFLWRKVI